MEFASCLTLCMHGSAEESNSLPFVFLVRVDCVQRFLELCIVAIIWAHRFEEANPANAGWLVCQVWLMVLANTSFSSSLCLSLRLVILVLEAHALSSAFLCACQKPVVEKATALFLTATDAYVICLAGSVFRVHAHRSHLDVAAHVRRDWSPQQQTR
jgi:hypothetical protein